MFSYYVKPPLHSSDLPRLFAERSPDHFAPSPCRIAPRLADPQRMKKQLQTSGNGNVVPQVLVRSESWPRHVLLDAEKLACEAGTVKAVNSIMLGAASGHLIATADELRSEIERFLAGEETDVVCKKLKSFDLGRQAAHTAGVTS